jgi:hypothetical protein
MTPGEVNVTDESASITVRATVTDNLSGFSRGSLWIVSPTSDQWIQFYFSESDRVSGTVLDGVYEVEISVPQYSEPGLWRVYAVSFFDRVGNQWYVNQFDSYYDELLDEYVPFDGVSAYFDSNNFPKTFSVTTTERTERELGRLDVINNPSAYGLVRLSDLQQASGNREQLVSLLGNLSELGLFTESDIMDLNLGTVTVRKQGSYASVWLQLQTSTNLTNWHDGDILEYSMPVPENKWFIRARALGSQ